MLQDLKNFLMRGNVVDLAVAVVIGAAFTLVINSFVNDVIMATIGALFGRPNFDELTFRVGDGVVFYGRFLTALVNFVIVGTALFFFVRAIQRLGRRRTDEPEEVPMEVQLLTEIRDSLREHR